MKNLKELLSECESRAFNCCVVVQSVTSYSVEIYTGHKKTYINIFYTDGHTKPKKAIKKALKFIQKH